MPIRLALILGVCAGAAMAEADGPDAWRVTGVAPDDSLNLRAGPGVDYPVIDTLAHDARGLTAITCVPLLSYADWERFQGTDLPPRWCLVSQDLTRGWAAGRFLAEDVAAAPD